MILVCDQPAKNFQLEYLIHGLLMVGKIPKGERLYKTAIIPKELMEYLDG